MILNLYAEGITYNSMDDTSEAEITSLFLESVRSYGMLVGRINAYTEADNSKSNGGFFSKIINFFSNLVQKIAEFIRKFISKVVEIVARPFGIKLKAAESGGSSGSTTVRSSESESSSTAGTVIKGIEGNLKEINNVMHSVIRYASGSNPHDFGADYFKGKIIPEYIVSESDIDVITKPSDLLYSRQDVDALREKIDDVADAIVESVGALGKVYDDKVNVDKYFIQAIGADGKAAISKTHKDFSMQCDVLKYESDDTLQKLANALQGGYFIISSVVDTSKTFTSSMTKSTKGNKTNDERNAIGLSAIRSIIGKSASKDKYNVISIGQDNPFKLFGLPAREAVAVYRYAMIASGGTDVIKAVTPEYIDKRIKERRELDMFNIKTISKYKDMLEKPVFDEKQVKDLFETITLEGNKSLTDLAKRIKGYGIKNQGINLLNDVLDDVIKLNKELNTKDEDTDTTATTRLTEDMEKLNVEGAVKSFVSASAKNVRAMSTAVVKYADDLKFTYNTYQSLKYIPTVYVLGNTIYWLVDLFNQGLNNLIEFRKVDKFESVYTDDSEKKEYETHIKSAKADLIKAIKKELGVERD